MLNAIEQKKIGELLSTMSRYSLNQPLMQELIVTELANIIETKSFCSIARMATTGTRTAGAVGKPIHINMGYLEKAMMPLWDRSVSSGSNPIAVAILREAKQSENTRYFATAAELLEDAKPNAKTKLASLIFNKMVKKTQFTERGLGYLWLPLASGYIWVFCLRRKKEGPFTQRQHLLLQQFALNALGNQASWYIPAFDYLDKANKVLKNKLTQRQFETLFHLGNHCSRKECADLMDVSAATIDRNVENLLTTFREHFTELNGKGIPQIIRELKNNKPQSLEGINQK